MEQQKTLLNNDLLKAAQELGEALRASPVILAHVRAVGQLEEDGEAGQLKARLEALYDDLVQRQNAGEIITAGEIDQYYELEREVKQHPALTRQAQTFERIQDLMTGTHDLLTNELGFSFIDLAR